MDVKLTEEQQFAKKENYQDCTVAQLGAALDDLRRYVFGLQGHVDHNSRAIKHLQDSEK